MADEEQITLLASMFPDVPRDNLKRVFLKANRNVDAAVDLLLSGQEFAEPPKTVHSNELNTFVDDEDALLAQQLQEQFNLEEGNQRMDTSTFDSDEMLAMRLQNDWNTGSNFKFHSPSSAYYGNTDLDIDLKALDTAVISELLSQVKDQIIPVITEELSKVELPPIDEQVETGSTGTVGFGVKNLGMQSIDVERKNINLKFEGFKLDMKITGITATMKEFFMVL